MNRQRNYKSQTIFSGVSPKNPCVICGSTRKCFTINLAACCRQIKSDIEKADRHDNPYYVHENALDKVEGRISHDLKAIKSLARSSFKVELDERQADHLTELCYQCLIHPSYCTGLIALGSHGKKITAKGLVGRTGLKFLKKGIRIRKRQADHANTVVNRLISACSDSELLHLSCINRKQRVSVNKTFLQARFGKNEDNFK